MNAPGGQGGQGYGVVIDALRRYSGTLADKKATAREVSGLVGQSDVSNESWGVVGLFVFDDYSKLLGDLRDLLGDMENGLQTASEKYAAAADAYQEAEIAHRDALTEVLKKLQAPGPAN